MKEKINQVLKDIEVRKEFEKLGIYSGMIIGPRGPKGDGITIKGDYHSLEELKKNHPIGSVGDCYIIEGTLYVWNIDTNTWDSVGDIKGPKGDTETFVIGKTTTGSPNTEAKVKDEKVGLQHTLEFVIPKGDQGPKGEQGPQGIQGPKGDKGDPGVGIENPASYDAIFFLSFAQAIYTRTMTVQDSIKIPDDENVFAFTSANEFQIKKAGYYEITLCGQISGVDSTHGALFYLIDTNGQIVTDLSFELKKGNTPRMDVSETIVIKLEEGKTLCVKCAIDGTQDDSMVDFSNVNLILKKYHMVI